MQIVLKIPDLVDISIQDITSKVSDLQNQLNGVNQDIAALKAKASIELLTELRNLYKHKL